MKKFSLLMLSCLLCTVWAFAQSSPCSQLSANFTYTQNGNSVTLTNTSTLPTGGTNPISYTTVYFGDGSYAACNTTVTHNYTANGNYSIVFVVNWSDTITVSNVINCVDTVVQTVTVSSLPSCSQLNAGFTYTQSGNSITITNTSTYPTGGTNADTLAWVDWGDGTSNYNFGTSVTHAYTFNGTYAVMLNAQWIDSLANPYGSAIVCTDVDTQFFTVTSQPSPCSQLNANFTYSQVGNVVSVTNTSTLPSGNNSITVAQVDFGDGSLLSNTNSNVVTHNYTANGVYQIQLIQSWSDTISQTPLYIAVCGDTSAPQTITVSSIPPPCNVSISSVTNNGMGAYTFTANSSSSSPSFTWNFGDGTSATGNPVTHTYTNNGNYLVQVAASGNSCSTNYDTTNVMVSINDIRGYVTFDSTLVNSNFTTSFKVWLIEATFDSVANSYFLTAVDSTILSTPSTYVWNIAFFHFYNKPAGTYYIKAAIAPGATNPGLIPTYAFNSAIWINASPVYYSGSGISYNNGIAMISGTPGTGPGFVGGYVNQGAGKGTNTGVPNLLILLRDANDKIIAATYTDATGKYSFGNLAYGTYSIYPEAMNYHTTASNSLVIGNGTNVYNSIDFVKTSTAIKPQATGLNDVAIHPFTIYPNPTKGQVTINWENGVNGDVQIQVTDIAGKTVYSETTVASGKYNLNIAHLNRGIYFIKINTNKGHFTDKIVLQ